MGVLPVEDRRDLLRLLVEQEVSCPIVAVDHGRAGVARGQVRSQPALGERGHWHHLYGVLTPDPGPPVQLPPGGLVRVGIGNIEAGEVGGSPVEVVDTSQQLQVLRPQSSPQARVEGGADTGHLRAACLARWLRDTVDEVHDGGRVAEVFALVVQPQHLRSGNVSAVGIERLGLAAPVRLARRLDRVHPQDEAIGMTVALEREDELLLRRAASDPAHRCHRASIADLVEEVDQQRSRLIVGDRLVAAARENALLLAVQQACDAGIHVATSLFGHLSVHLCYLRKCQPKLSWSQ